MAKSTRRSGQLTRPPGCAYTGQRSASDVQTLGVICREPAQAFKAGIAPHQREESLSCSPALAKARAQEQVEHVNQKELKLRNYTPEDEELKERQVPKAKPASVEEKVKDQLEAANPEPIIEEVDLANLAPRKPDWDLKRDVAKKLEKLERRTQRAIAELIRDRLRGSEEELAGAVGAVGMEEGDSD
uniref:Coiled-coil domain containing 12 n=1 Tax=Fundulus heteroclitus TaxID=8078 RepID=A0A3Q2PP06_FUNHE